MQMHIRTIMRTGICLATLLLSVSLLQAQTSWKGITSTNWSTASNWTAGVPTSTTDVIIGDASFTGVYQPSIGTVSTCKSLTIGGTTSSTLTIGKNLSVAGSVTINANGSIIQNKSSLSLTGNWINNGTYTANNNNAAVIFNGITQTISGVATTFRRITVNSSSTVTLATNYTVSGSGSQMTVNGILNPGESPTYTVTTPAFTLGATATLHVKASTFAANYNVSGAITLLAGSIVDYSATSNQTISNSLTYSTLRVSGTGTKTLAGNLPALNSINSTAGNIYVAAATLDLSTYTANRGTTVAGGTLYVANSALLKIGGTNTYPSNYASSILMLDGTVEYSGTNQTVSAQSYGNLLLTSSSGAAIKTMPAAAFTVTGNLTSSIGSGTSVTFTAASDISVSRNLTIGTSTTFNGGSYTHNITGNWTNAGTFNGNTGTVNFSGPGAIISGAGTHNFNNLTISGSNGSCTGTTNIVVGGNLTTSGSGNFTHQTGGTLTMSGTSKSISGAGIVLNNLTITGTTTSDANFEIAGNFSCSGSIAASAGSIRMSGTSKTISGAGTINLYGLSITGSVTSSTSITINSTLDVNGSFSASTGTTTFAGVSTLNGTANLYNANVNGTSFQLASNAVLGIASTFSITAGSFNVSTTIPNTVYYNGTGAQSILATTYNQLQLGNGNTKTAAGAITVNGNLVIGSSTTFNASSYTHSIYGNWINNGTFTASTSTIQLAGNADATISGTNTFNILTVNKSATNTVTLSNNIDVANINMTNGTVRTGSNTLNITTTRSGNGIILGTIKRTHSFNIGTSYAFEGPDNTIIFTTASGISSITVTVTPGSISDFPFGASVNRLYNVSIPVGSYIGTLRLHYEDAELNGNTESSLNLWKYSAGAWSSAGRTGNSTTSNYVELALQSDVSTRWTCSYTQTVIGWTGSVNNDWNTPGNWTSIQGSPGSVPASTDIVQIGTSSFTNQPTITSAVSVKSILFGSVQTSTLTIGNSGSLTVNGNINGAWSGNATHNINVGAQNLTVNGNLALSDGTTNHAINLSVSSGAIAVTGELTQSGGAAINFTGNGTLSIGSHFNYGTGTFTPATGTVTYNGNGAQTVAGVTYNNLTINKSAGIGTISSALTINGNLNISGGELNLNGSTVIVGNNTIASGATLKADGIAVLIGGNWSNSGSFVSGSGTVTFNGTGNQSVSGGTFNNLAVNNAGNTLTFLGNVTINSNFSITTGTTDLSSYTCNRSSNGGTFTMSAGTILKVGGSSFPLNFGVYSIDNNSTVHYNGAGTQSVTGNSYGHLVFSNGGSNLKTFAGSATINGDITINSGANVSGNTNTISLNGNWINSGTFTPATSTLVLNGTTKTISGNTNFNKVTVNGSYTVLNSDISYNGRLFITSTGSYAAGSGVATVNGDLVNSGSLTSTGTTTFSGTTVQTIQLLNAIVSTSSGIVNFNGSVTPILNSTSKPTFANLVINNTAGVSPSIGWNVMTSMTVASGSAFYGGPGVHNIYGSFTNNGTVTSSGTFNFSPSTNATVAFGSNFTSTGSVYFAGAAAISISGTPTLTDVFVNNTNAAGVTPASNWSMNDFNINSDARFNASSYSHTVTGNIESNGTLDGGSSTFNLTGATAGLTGSPTTTFNHLTITGGIIANSDFNVSGNFTNNGTFDGSVAAVIMTGSNNATVGGTTTPSTIAQLTVSKASTAQINMAVNINSLVNLNITSGTLFTSTYSATQDVGGGVLIIRDNATLKLGGNLALPAFSGYVLDSFSTVDFAGLTQNMSTSVVYGNLTISATGTKTPLGNLNVLNNFTLTNGTFASGNFTHNIGGNWIMTGGTFNSTANTIRLNGAGNQTINSNGAFNNLVLNKTSGNTTLASNISVNTTLNLLSGKLTLDAYNLTIGNSGTISNASSTNYIIATGAGVLNQQVTASGSKTFPVGLSNAYTPSIVALTAGSTSDVFGIRMLSSVYRGGTSGDVVTTKSVNATWMISEAVVGGSNATVTVEWPLALEMSGFSRTFSRLAHYEGGDWDYGTADVAAGGSGPYTISRSGFTSFSPFAVSMFMALPVTWLNVEGKNENDKNIIEWGTVNEENNEYFTVEYSTDGISFTALGQVPGAGTTSLEHHYRYTHNNISSGNHYYRIKQTDLDGRFSYSKTILIRVSNGLTGNLKLYPNPVDGDNTIVGFYLQQSAMVTINLYSSNGRLVKSEKAYYGRGQHSVPFSTSNVASGVYILSIRDERGNEQTIKLIKK